MRDQLENSPKWDQVYQPRRPTAGDNLFPAANPRQKVCAKESKDTDLKRLQRPRFSHKHRERGICKQKKNTNADPDSRTRRRNDYIFSQTRAHIDGNDRQRDHCKPSEAPNANFVLTSPSGPLASSSNLARGLPAPSSLSPTGWLRASSLRRFRLQDRYRPLPGLRRTTRSRSESCRIPLLH